jgi:hypothetical protein
MLLQRCYITLYNEYQMYYNINIQQWAIILLHICYNEYQVLPVSISNNGQLYCYTFVM